MICKWCGATMTGSESACRRCGKAQPALSQCGGFYDLVPAARPAAPAVTKETRKRSPLTAVLAILCVILAAALVVVWMGKQGLRTENERLKYRLEKLEGSGVEEGEIQPGGIPWGDASEIDAESGEE